MSTLLIHPEVSEEFAEAANWYRSIDPEFRESGL